MFQAPDPKSPLFDMVAGIVNAHAALVRAQPAEPIVTRIEFAAGHEDERLTDEGVAAKLRLMKAAPALAEGVRLAISTMTSVAVALAEQGFPATAESVRREVRVLQRVLDIAEGRSPQEEA
jgi:hypothetical protein